MSQHIMPLTKGLAHFAAHSPDIPEQALAIAKDGITDAVGLMLAAASDPSVVAAKNAIGATESSGGNSSVLLSSVRARANDAAFVNGTAIHAFAMDDVAWGCHPSAVLLAALLAEGERVNASGMALLRAWVIGYEVLAELVSRERDALHSTGWHPTGLVGPVAAAAAICHLTGQSADVTRNALGIAASFGGGLSVNFGTQTKALHAGRTASSGVTAAALAESGITAAAHALEHANGLLKTISPNGNVDIGSGYDPQNPPWHILDAGNSIKQYPLCYTVHRIIDASKELASSHDFSIGDISRIDVRIGRKQAELAHHTSPTTILEAKYSVEFAVICGLIAKDAGFSQLTPEFISSDSVQALLKLTHRSLIEEFSKDEPLFAPADRVKVTLADGRVLDSGDVAYAKGHAKYPMDEQDLKTKFFNCTALSGTKNTEAIYHALRDIEQIRDISELSALLSR